MDRDFSFFVIITNFLVFCQQPATLGSTLRYSGIILSPKRITSAFVWRQKQTVQHIYLKMPKLTTGHFELATKSGDSVNFRHIILTESCLDEEMFYWFDEILRCLKLCIIWHHHIKLYQKEMKERVLTPSWKVDLDPSILIGVFLEYEM